ncbi:MAG: nonstructural polyprotein [Corattcep virus 1]|nr:MAG: nonstructural polyprotein [Corattcep virus 1]
MNSFKQQTQQQNNLKWTYNKMLVRVEIDDYKTLCRQQIYKNRKSKFDLEQIKMQQRINRINRLELRKERIDCAKGTMKIKANMQMMAALGSFIAPTVTGLYTAKQLNHYGKKILETKGKADDMLESAKALLDNSNGIVERFACFTNAIVENVAVKSRESRSFLILITEIVTALVQLIWTKPEHLLKSFALSMSAIFIRYGLSQLWKFLEPFLIPSKEVEMQIGLDCRTLLSRVFEYFGYVLVALLSNFIIKEGIMQKKTLDMFKYIGSISLCIKTVRDLDVAFPKLFNFLTEFLCRHFGIIPYDELNEIIEGYEEWSKKVVELMRRDPVTDESSADKIVYDRDFVIKIEQLYKEGVEITKKINEKRVPNKIQKQFLILMKFLEQKFKQTDITGAFGGKPRTEPVIIWLYGEAGQGKSYISNPFAMLIAKTLNHFIPEDRLFSEIYNRNVEQEYWDGYTGQSVVIYDDFGQKVDSSSDNNPEFMEIIRAGNISPFPLHMAALEDKRRARFQSKAVILSSNVRTPQINSLTFPAAFYRRISLQLKVTCKEEYCYEAKPGVFRADISKINAAKIERGMDEDDFFTDCYVFEHTDPETGNLIDYYNFEQVIQIIKTKTLEKYESTSRYVESCKRFMSKMQIDDEFVESGETLEPEDVDMGKWYSVNGARVYGERLVEEIINGSLYFRDDVFEYATPLFIRIKQRLDGISKDFKEYRDSAIKFIKENPYYLALGAGATLISGLAIFKVWNHFVLPNERVVIASDALGFERISRNADILERIVDGTDKIELTEKQFNKYRTRMELLCDKMDKTIHVSVLPTKIEARISGDNLTAKTISRHIEGYVSGDSVTQKKENCKIEGQVSGDNVTRRQELRRIEGQVSGDNITRKMDVRKVEGALPNVDVDMQMWKDEVAQTLITNRIWSNLYRISGVRTGEKRPLLNGLFVRSRCMLVPGHLTDFLYKYSEIYIENVVGEQYTIPIKDIRAIRITNSFGEDKEAVLLVFPKSVKAHSNIIKHFSNGESMGQYRHADIALPLIRYSIKNLYAMILGNTECVAYDQPIILEDDTKGEYVLRTGLQYRLNTINGDCGAPVIINETSVLRKIAGIHVAGSRDGKAFAESITQKDLMRALNYVDPSDKIIFDPDNVPNLTLLKFSTEMQLNKEITKEQLIRVFKIPAENFSFVGNANEIVFSPHKTTLRPSIVQNCVTKTTTKPCYLYHPEEDMYKKNLLKCATHTPYIEGKILEAAVNDVKKQLFKGTDRRLARILTLEEAIQGSQDSEYIGPLNRSTSAGYPWVLHRKGNTKGKQGWLGDGEYVFDKQLMNAVQQRVDAAKCGERAPVVWTDTLKDERRPIEKVEALKTRVFAHGPMDFTIVFRQYFLGFIAHIMENRVDNEQSIGTNVYSKDWAYTVKKLQSKGEKVIAGDFSTFDGTLNVGILSRFADVVSEWYDDGPENRLIRNVLMEDIYNSLHLVHDVFYQMNHSQPSGNPATTILNSFYNSVSMRMVFSLCAKSVGENSAMRNFNDNVSMVSYGDDNVVNISNRVIKWFNQNTITENYLKIGMIYTDEAKTDSTISDFRHIDEVGYLKRHFIKRGVNRWMAPLEIGTILEMCNWMRGDLDPKTATQVNCENAIMELSMHERVVWDEYEPQIQRAFYRKAGYHLDTLTYEEYEEKRLFEYFL